MIEWVKVSTIIIDQIFKYGPQISNLFKSKESKQRQFQLKILSTDIASQIEKNLLNDLKAMMDYTLNIPKRKEELEELKKVTQNIVKIESNKMLIKMRDLIINQFNDILLDNLLCTPKYHNLVIVGSSQIYKIIDKLYNENFTIDGNVEKFQLFSTKKPDFRAGLLLYALNISDKLISNKSITPPDLNVTKKKLEKNNDTKDKDNKDKINIMKKVSNEILIFIRNTNKKFYNSLNRKITGIMICVDNQEEYKKINELIEYLKSSIIKHKFELDLYLIITNKNIDFKITYNNDKKATDEHNNNIINIKDENYNTNDIKHFFITINEDEDLETLEEEKDSEIENFLNELVYKYIDDYMKNNINNIQCTLNLQYYENIKYYFQKLEKEFNRAVVEMKNFNIKSIPLKVEFESQIKKIFIDIFTNHIYPISIKPVINKNIKSQLTNQSLNHINDFFNYNYKRVKELTNKGKSEYTERLTSQVKDKINELFSEIELDEQDKEKIEEQNLLKKNFVNDIIEILKEKIALGSDIYDLCLVFFYISKDLFRVLYEKIWEFCGKHILQNKKFKEEINKRIIQQIDSYQRKVLNID